MKELSIEEKAKRYDESIARAKKLMETCNSTAVVGWCEYIFKELKFFESEDEKIRKSLIDVISEWSEDTGFGRYNVPRNEVIAWLEKQVEQKSINYADEEIVEAVKDTSVLDMVEPKFKAGQWIIDPQDGGILHINKALEYAYEVTNLKSGSYQISRCSIETSYKPWTIQDAKDGDVLFSPSHNLLWLHKDEKVCHVCINLNYNDSLSIESDFVTPSDVSPATKERRDLLFSKMKEYGFEWDAVKKELYNIDSNIDSFCKNHCKGYKETGRCFSDGGCQAKKDAESIWSKEDISKLNKIATTIYEAGEVQNWWRQSRLIDKETANELNNWLKSLKERYTWKPSEEQIQALEYQVHSTYKGSWQYRASKELLEQLKKF